MLENKWCETDLSFLKVNKNTFLELSKKQFKLLSYWILASFEEKNTYWNFKKHKLLLTKFNKNIF